MAGIAGCSPHTDACADQSSDLGDVRRVDIDAVVFAGCVAHRSVEYDRRSAGGHEETEARRLTIIRFQIEQWLGECKLVVAFGFIDRYRSNPYRGLWRAFVFLKGPPLESRQAA